MSIPATCALGFALGLRHALEPDHLAAVSTLAAQDSQSARRRVLYLGTLWGVGHTLALLMTAGVLLAMRTGMPAEAATAVDLLVAGLLVGLGARNLELARRELVHGPRAHVVERLHTHRWGGVGGPLLLGLAHGLAGSGALTAAVVAELPSVAAQLGYLLLFGAGLTLGMAVCGGLLGLPLRRLIGRGGARAGLLAITGLLSLLVGGRWFVMELSARI